MGPGNDVEGLFVKTGEVRMCESNRSAMVVLKCGTRAIIGAEGVMYKL